MDRPKVVQRLLNLRESPAYLEIGVNHGITFHAVTAIRKVAVDPQFNFDVAAARQAAGETADYHQVPSDEYFAAKPQDEMFDVIFLDGLHTFDQTLARSPQRDRLPQGRWRDRDRRHHPILLRRFAANHGEDVRVS